MLPGFCTDGRHAGFVEKRMKVLRLAPALLTVLVTAGPSAAASAIDSCAAATHAFRVTQAQVRAAAASYSTCISAQFGRDDCTDDFATVGQAQADFAASVAIVFTQCGQ